MSPSLYHIVARALALMTGLLGCQYIFAQNITVASGGVNWIGANNGYTQPINGTSTSNVLQYRKVSTTTANPQGGRGQWYCTLNAQASGGDVVTQNMAGGAGDGFFLTNGGGAGSIGTYANTWGVAVGSVLSLNAVNAISDNSYEPMVEMGLDMSVAGYYSFIMQDSGANKKSNVYIGYTSNTPVTISHVSASQRWVLSDRSAYLQATLSATPSSGENLYVRYKTATNDFSVGGSSIVSATIVNGTKASFTIPAQAASSTVYYYIFSSTISLSSLNALTEGEKSLACLKYADNSGSNYSYTIPAIGTVYQHLFNTNPSGSTNYITTPNTFNANLNSSAWTSSGGAFTNARGNGNSNYGLGITSVGNNTYTLTFNVANGYALTISSFDIWLYSDQASNQLTSITINGITITSTTYTAPTGPNAGSGALIGQTSVANPVNNISGTVTVVISLANGGNGGDFRIDNFTLYGNVVANPTGTDYVWNGSSSNSFKNSNNWTPNGIPSSTDNIIISSASPNPVNISTAQTVNNVSLTGTGVLQLASGASLTIAGSFAYSGTATASFNCGSTVNFTSAALQIIPAFSYGNLNLAGGPRAFEAGKTLGICGNYTPTASTTSTNGSIVKFNGTSSQSILTNPAFFDTLLIASTNTTVTSNVAITINAGNILTINNSARLSMGINMLDIGGSIVQVNGYLRTGGYINGASVSSLFINSNGTFEYDSSRTGLTDLGTIPTATWASGSTLAITGLTNPTAGTWFAGGLNQGYSNFSWNTPSLTTSPLVDAAGISLNGTFSVASTGTSQLRLASTTDATVTTVNFIQSGGTINFSDGIANTSMHVTGDFAQTGGSILYSGSGGSNAIYFDGTSNQNLSGTTSASSTILYQFDNSAGFTVTGSVPVFGTALVKNGAFSGTGSLYFNKIGTLSYDCPSPRVPVSAEWPATGYPNNVILTNGINLQLAENKSGNQLTLNNGTVSLGNYSLVLYDSLGLGVIPAQPFSVSNMLIANGSGKLGRAIANTQSLPISYLFPIGNSFYSPANYNFTTNSQPRILYVNMVDATHSSLTGTDFMANHYWRTDLSESAGTYNYTVSYAYQSGDEQGTVSNIRLSRWSGLIWSNVSTSSVSIPYLNSNSVNETTAPLYGPADWTGRAHVATQTYYWKFPASGAWTTAGNWTPAGVPTSGDAVVFNQNATTAVTNVPSGIYLTSMSFLGGGNITLQAGTSGIINVSGAGSPDLSIDANTSVTIAGTTGLTINVSSGDSGIVYGKVYLKGGAHTFSATDAGGLTFKNGSYFTLGVSGGTTYTGYGCGYNGNNYTTVFESGSIMEQFEGPDPFGRPDSALYINKIQFDSGSTYRYSDIGASRTPYFNGRHYYNYEYNVTNNKTATGSIPFVVNNITINLGTLNINAESSVNYVTGNVTINGTAFNILPVIGAAYYFNSGGQQTVSGAGSFTISNSLIQISSGTTLILNRNLTVNSSSFYVDGTLDVGTSVISGTGLTSINSGGTVITGHAAGLSRFSSTGNIQTTSRQYSSSANYAFTNANGSTGDFIDFTSPIGQTVDSLAINTTGTITFGGSSGTINIKRLSLIAGNFNIISTSKNIFIPSGGLVRSTGGRMASGTAGGSVWFTGTASPGTSIYGDPQFYNAVILGGVNFIDHGTVNNTMQMSSGAIVYSAPTYAIGSTLRYSGGSAYSRGSEWDGLSGNPGYPWDVSVQNGTTLNLGTNSFSNLEIGGNLYVSQAFSNGSVAMNAITQPLTVQGNVYIGDINSTNSSLVMSSANGGDLYVGKSFIRKGPASNSLNISAATGTKAVYFTGSGNDSISSITTTSPLVYATQTFYKLGMQKTGSGNITLKSPVSVTNAADFSNGIIHTTSTNLLTVQTTGTVTGTPSNASFVNGPMARVTNSTVTEYSFPIGSNTVSVNKYRPVTITPAAATTTTYTAELKPATPTPNYTNQLAIGLTAIDNTVTWNISRNIATNARVSMDYKDPNNWITASGATLTPCASCKVAVVQYNNLSANNWAFTSGTFSGSPVMERLYTDENPIYSAANLNVAAGAFGFGLQYFSVLPVQLVSFNGILNNGDGILSWKVADVRDLDGFDLEESADGIQFKKKTTVVASGGLNYNFTDPQLKPGAHFYRLLVKEKSGRTFYSQVVLLTVGKIQTRIIGLKQNPVQSSVTPLISSANNQQVVAHITDVSGKRIATQQSNLFIGLNQWNIDLPTLSAGIYFIHITTADKVIATLKFIKQ